MFSKMLAADNSVNQIFGTIAPPVSGLPTDPQQGITSIVSFLIRAFFVIAALTMLAYLLWGAYDWITSGGEKEKVAKAQNKITNAVVGMLLTVALLVVYNLITSDILKIFPSWSISLPQLK
jgi:magnesium-transporting ATPase (P-type)